MATILSPKQFDKEWQEGIARKMHEKAVKEAQFKELVAEQEQENLMAERESKREWVEKGPRANKKVPGPRKGSKRDLVLRALETAMFTEEEVASIAEVRLHEVSQIAQNVGFRKLIILSNGKVTI